MWEALYLLQFISLEFFFRGFMVHGMKHRFGIYSVLVMTIPYCMIHFGKPLPETIAAIVAGIVLGTLSLKSRSILLGVCIHYSVGLMMDLAALWQKGLL
jgi:membrane protease YdiL (CAAX protease family)